MKTSRDSERQPSDGLWAEALWGLGLMGSVFGILLLLVTLIGR